MANPTLPPTAVIPAMDWERYISGERAMCDFSGERACAGVCIQSCVWRRFESSLQCSSLQVFSTHLLEVDNGIHR